MAEITFNKNPISWGNTIEQPSDEEVKTTPSLFNASLEDALLYGGDLTRKALSAMNIKGDRKHIIVDTKVHMLMEGMYPAIPGWHTDGVPRPDGKPDILAQEELNDTHFHLLVTGEGCLTDFLLEKYKMNVNVDNLYEEMSENVTEYAERFPALVHEIPTCQVVEWDWWNIHTAKAAQKREWRFLIRVTETDYRAPKNDLRDVLRTQQQVYVPEIFGW